MPTRDSEYKSGTGINGDWLIPLRNRPQIALSKSIIAILEGYGVTVPTSGPISVEHCRALPVAVLVVLASAGLLPRPVDVPPAVPLTKPSPYGRVPRHAPA